MATYLSLISNYILTSAIARGCRSVHIEPTSRQVLVHYRKDGVSFAPRKLSLSLLPDLIKTYKQMDKAKQISRVSSVPGKYGEHLVLWLD